jgi:hypothetical protein
MKTTTMSNKRALILLGLALLTSLILSLIVTHNQPYYASDPYDEQLQYRRAWRYLMN